MFRHFLMAVSIRPAWTSGNARLSYVLQRQQVLADGAEVGKLEQRPVMLPVLEHLLVAAGGVRGQALTVDDLGLAPPGEGVIAEVLEHVELSVDAGDDHVVAIYRRGRRCACAFCPSQHIEEGERVAAPCPAL